MQDSIQFNTETKNTAFGAQGGAIAESALGQNDGLRRVVRMAANWSGTRRS